jgi:hypothetical protein
MLEIIGEFAELISLIILFLVVTITPANKKSNQPEEVSVSKSK